MKVFLIYASDQDYYQVFGIASREKAKELQKKLIEGGFDNWGDIEIKEYELNDITDYVI